MSDKLEGLKEGDRVRVTFEGKVHDIGKGSVHVISDADCMNFMTVEEVNTPTFKIEKVAKPIGVGDRVTYQGEEYDVRLIEGSEVVIFGDGGLFVRHISSMEPVE